MNEFNNFKNKNVVVTGGTSGLGLALAVQLNELGARVAVLARNHGNLQKLIERYPKIIGIQGDVSKKEDIYPLTGEIHSRLGDLDILFNVASYLGQTPLRFLVDTECEDFELALQTNLLGPFRLTKALLPSMLLKVPCTLRLFQMRTLITLENRQIQHIKFFNLFLVKIFHKLGGRYESRQKFQTASQ